MREIIIDNNLLNDYEDANLLINDRKITFKKNGDYTLEYKNSDFISLDIEVLDGVMVKLFIWSCDNNLTVNNHYSLGKNSNLLLFQFYHNKSVCEQMVVDLNGEFSKFSQGFSSISMGNEEYDIIVNHNHHHVESYLSNKCIGLDGSKIKIQIDSVLDKGNHDCVMDQVSRILTLGDVEAEIIPNMFTHEDSVEAKHGSVIGSFRDEELFYLMSRGITENEAITLLIKGFIFSNLIVDMEKRARIFQIIQDLRR